MKIFYDKKTEQWYHSSLVQNMTMGGNKRVIDQMKEGSNNFSIELHTKNGHIGPLIGILTARKKNGDITGNGQLFRAIQKKLISMDGISFIFTIEDVGIDFINGYLFLPGKAQWLKVQFPFPDLVYNRVPFRKTEQDSNLQNFFTSLKSKKIPYFNPCFINKNELYQLFQNDTSLKTYIPKTLSAAYLETDLSDFLIKQKSIYLKPSQSAQGKGIYRVTLSSDNQIVLEGLKYSKSYQTFQEFWKEWEQVLLERNYLAQEEIKPALYEGKRFDFRILAHAEHETYSVTGIGIRQSQHQEITTHIPNGGKILPYRLLQSDEHDQFIQTIVMQIGKVLSRQFGFFGEFSIDAGMDRDGKYYIYEVNSKPMSFDELEIEEKRIAQLCRLFLQLTDFQS